METAKAGVGENPCSKTDRLVFAAQILFRIAATGTALAAACVIFNAKQTVVVMGMSFDAKYTYSPAFKFFALANAIACGFTFLSLVMAMLFSRHGLTASIYFIFFLHDLLMVSLMLSGVVAGTTIGAVGRDGNSKTGWLKICNRFEKYCGQVSTSLMLSYVAMICLLVLTITSAAKSRN
ncbi:ARM repeat superfamily protein isoform 1 [Hibiscus syriacus]|uniref:CASP-like protein n=1 Tax=Hibiscus syriacus TaxID=106335 RepID=A0A6A3C3H3_HIBSY|nr:CASP-like protein 1F1 [Hibiscus syriacus]KAE8721752.1 ARM repeat superfamily protein isoform 1 [Hibiscus syriacus]